MDRQKSVIQILLAAALFGSSAPISKLLLGKIEPIPMAAFLYIGSGLGIFIFKQIEGVLNKRSEQEAPLRKKDIPWLLGAVSFGGVFAPIILMNSLQSTPASTASLLLNFEGVATTLIAAALFKESIGKRIWTAILIITLSSIVLSWDFSNQWGISPGSLGIVAACFCWGMDNNFTGKISLKNPFSIVTIKGFSAGIFSLFLALLLKNPMPSFKTILLAMILGCFSYGFSIVLFVLALRGLGSARTSAFFATAPFIGTILSFIVFKENIEYNFIIGFSIMILGTILLLKESHIHEHFHSFETHEHRHCHSDEHHNHSHPMEELNRSKWHSHVHTHNEISHCHEHTPDVHHRHEHKED
ncbi:EamA family transporter [Clostridium sp. CX1]|uniref:DMT family transporter n=1 Tax=Clostridium sp. CX1 TaxID=2978346 RepID=UPI0021C01060|nr:DMT family transporter [Clostridium sp. CX1]MCT8977455.1 EamA family transporter [Clostridium sp. CX1]